MFRFSLECLLSYIAFTQYQDILKEYIEDDEALEKVNIFRFPENIPMTGVLETVHTKSEEQEIKECGDEDVDDVVDLHSELILNNAKLMAFEIYERFIKEGSEFEINISSLQRKPLINLLDDLENLMKIDITIVNLFLLFEDAKYEMWHLMQFSLQRFQGESDFKQVQMIFNNNNVSMV